MIDIIIIGASGFGKEVVYYINAINKIKPSFNVLGFIDDNPMIFGCEIIYGIKVIGNLDYLISNDNISKSVCVAIADNFARTTIVDKIKNNNFHFPNIIHPSVDIDITNNIGFGNIIGHNTLLTCSISIGNYNILNGAVGIGHDVVIGDFNLFGPRSTISGNVKIGNGNTVNMLSSIIQNIKIGDRNVINLHSCLFKSIKDDGVYFGVPAMKQRF
jgi:sugar O-acyltransferase (sialic acid O-acetyltransferase NeuD family)